MSSVTKKTLSKFSNSNGAPNWQSSHLGRASFICLLASLFYLYEFLLRVAPSVMTDNLMHSWGVTAGGIGLVSAFYFYSYTPMQIPSGLLLDRFGPRKLMSSMIFICALGAFVFSRADGIASASLARFLMGFGSAVGFIGVLVLVARWFPPYYFALVAGLVQFMGALGAIMGEAPLAHLVDTIGWRKSMWVAAAAGIVLMVLMWLFIRDNPPGYEEQKVAGRSLMPEIKRLRRVLMKPQSWTIAAYAFCVWAPVSVFAALWGVPFLQTAYNLSKTSASGFVSLIWVGVAIGCPVFGWISSYIGRRCIVLTICGAIGTVASICLIYISGMSHFWIWLSLFGFGLAAAGQSVSFAAVKDSNKLDVVGTAVSFNNMAVVAGGALFQPIVGYILNLNWSRHVYHGTPIYSLSSYRWALLLIPICYALSIVISQVFVKETYCQHVE